MALWSISFGAWVEKNFDESYALALRSRELFQAAEDAQTVPRITTVTARALARSSISDENQVRHMIGLIDDSLMVIGNSVESYDRTYLLASKAELLVKIGDFVAADTVLASIEDVIVKEVDYAGSHYLHAGEVALNIGTTAKALENFSKSRRAIDQLSDKDAAEAAFLRGRLADNYKAIGDTETAFEIARGIKLVDVPVG
jgi:tetratricopeptide (TPR) repeat protein